MIKTLNLLLPVVSASSLLALNIQAATPFEACPTQAFIIQTPSALTITYGVDLSTGSYTVLSSDMNTGKVNAVGFSYHDSFLYGWDYDNNTLSRFGAEFEPEPLNIVSGKIGTTFYVGDVSLTENRWYGYRSGHGLYSVDLSVDTGDYVMEKIASAQDMGSPPLTDLAFHPTNGLIYAVDNDGYLLEINPEDGLTTRISQVLSEQALGFSFTFGAQFFDVDENLYVSNNSNGYVYRIDLQTEVADFFAYGPISRSNDGARCALAPVISSTPLDFGDAPDTYQTSFDAAGPRHGIGNLYLGSRVDGESDAYLYPLSDDSSDGADDDDGIAFVTGAELGESALLLASASTVGGYLNAWVDWDGDGHFANDEQILNDRSLSTGENLLAYEVPVWAEPGQTWARFRISSTPGIGPTGGVADGEVEDYVLSVSEGNVTLNYYPSASEYTTLAYEDLWPREGDFDMNDLLINLKIAQTIRENEVLRLTIDGQVAAVGASYRNGFAIRLPGVPRSKIRQESIKLKVNGIGVNARVLDADAAEAILEISENIWTMVNPGEGACTFFRTQDGCGSLMRPSFQLSLTLSEPVPVTQFPMAPFDPFIFATPGYARGNLGSHTGISTPGRSWEVHLKNQTPTERFDRAFLALAEDRSVPGSNEYFLNEEGMGWAIEVPQNWKHPQEAVDLREAFPHFQNFAESSGADHPDWYTEDKANTAVLFQD